MIGLICLGLSILPATIASATVVSPVWARHYDGAEGYRDSPTALALSPDGSRIFVTGQSTGPSGVEDYATIAYDARGRTLWERRYDGPDGLRDAATALAVSPGGARVFVTGESVGSSSGIDYVTIAYQARSGAKLWTARFDGGTERTDDSARAIGVSPDGARIFVTGSSGEDQAYATIAYDAVTGTQLWVTGYAGPRPGGYFDGPSALGVSPDGSSVFVTGSTSTEPTWSDYTTIAYDSSTGAQRWLQRYNGPLGQTDDARALAVTPDGSAVVVTGGITGAGGWNYATVRYDAVTGRQQWARRYDGPNNAPDVATEVAVSPDGSRVFVTGSSEWWNTDYNYLTVAYTAGGAELWSRRYDGPVHGYDAPTALGVAHDGSAVFVTGRTETLEGDGLATVAYDAATGVQRWSALHERPGIRTRYVGSTGGLAVSPGGGRVYVTGSTHQGWEGSNYATLAYRLP